MRGLGLSILLAVMAVSTAAMAQQPRSQAEGLQLLQAANFKMRGGVALNICSTPATPKFTFLDINGDGRQEAIATDKNAACYGAPGDWFAVLIKGPDGRWRSMMMDVGTIRWETTRSRGWLDARIDTDCDRVWRYGGERYEAGRCLAKASAPAPTMGPAKPVLTASGPVTAADKAAALRATGSVQRGGKWIDPSSEGNCDAFIDAEGVKDLNGDGRPDIVVTGSGSYCYGNTGQGYWLLEKTPAGAWRVVDQNQGIPTFLPTRGVRGWPDIEVGGPGFCFPILRYDGKTYVLNRKKAYQPGACAGR